MLFYTMAPAGSVGTLNLNNASAYVDFLFSPPTAGPLNSIRCRTTGVTGSISTTDITVSLYAVDSQRMPTGSPLATGNFSALAYGIQTCTFGTPYNVSTGTIYCIRIMNVNSNPASNYTGISAVSYIAECPFYATSRAYAGSGVPYVLANDAANEMSVTINGVRYEKPVANYHANYGYSYGYMVYSTTTAKRYVGSEYIFNTACTIAGAYCGISTNGATVSRSDMRLLLIDSVNNVLASAPFTIKSGSWGNYPLVLFDSYVDVQAGTYRLVVCGDAPFGTEWNSASPAKCMFAGDRSSPENQYTTYVRTGYLIYGESSSANLPTWTSNTSYCLFPTPVIDIKAGASGGLLVNPGLNGGFN